VFGRKLSIEDDLYEKLKKCSEPAGYATPEEFALHVLEKEVERILGGGGETDEEIIKKRLQGLGYID
jgi:predicted CopG family antitoxin